VLTLALDTTTKGGSVALVDGDRLIAVIHGDATRTHGERLPGEIGQALTAAGVSPRELGLLAVATGPGAFTGLRIGLASMQGLAMVTGCPVVGVSALDALAATVLEVAESRVLAVAPWIDAQRGEVFAGFYPRGALTASGCEANASPMVGTPAVVLAALPSDLASGTVFVGDGALRYHAEIARACGEGAQVETAPEALAPMIARLGQRLAARGLAGPPHALQPLYVRRPDAELERARTPSRGDSSPSRDDVSREIL
jgi:tRNA threonylcarbamoyladenosine biosynthesis protein TsaB